MICTITKKCKTNNKNKKTKVCWHEIAVVAVAVVAVVIVGLSVIA